MNFPSQAQANHVSDILSSLGDIVPEVIFGDTYKAYKDKCIPVLYV